MYEGLIQAQRTWSVGELARETGLTVRTLHHYDECGLLRPSERTQAGHRRYAARDLERLYRIVALRGLGLKLGEIRGLLDGEGDLAGTVRRQLDQVERRIEAHRRLRAVLLRILDTLDDRPEPDVGDILQAIEVTKMVERYYTPEQLERLAGRRQRLGDDRIKELEREWAEVYAGLRAEMEAGTDPADPRLRGFAERADELIRMFTAGEADIAQSLANMWRNEDPETVSRGTADRELVDYFGRVQAAARGGAPGS